MPCAWGLFCWLQIARKLLLKKINLVSLKLVREKSIPYPVALDGPGAAVAQAQELLEDRDREMFVSIYMDFKHVPMAMEVCAEGTATQCMVSPGVVFRGALLMASTAVIFAHNHPSGNPMPSAEDYALTRTLLDAGNLLGIRVLDHLVIGDGNWLGSREKSPNMGRA